MSRKSAGILPYRIVDGSLQVLLVHPGGPYWVRKDEGAWSIAKGEYGDDEAPFDAALREFEEETGHRPQGGFIALTPIRQPGGKRVTAWAVEDAWDLAGFRSNRFSMEWPPRSGRMAEFDEVDRLGWFELEDARRKLLRGQLGLLDELVARLTGTGEDGITPPRRPPAPPQ